ncbi:uncharacterized protein METZ01_LOCUS364421, partial [marine metagenome]
MPMSSIELDSVVLRLREGDHVGVLKKSIKAGTELVDSDGTMTAPVTIPAGHKIALQPVANGEPVRKYGQIIGFAEGNIKPGEHVHSHNLVCKAYEREHSFCVDYEPSDFYPENECRTFKGFGRPGGRVGTRNYIAVISN